MEIPFKVLCAEHIMRHRLEVVQATGAEPVFDVPTLATIPAADTVFQGLALCLSCLQQMTQIQQRSSLVAPNGQQLVVPGVSR